MENNSNIHRLHFIPDDVPGILRELADKLEKQQVRADEITMVIDGEIHHFGFSMNDDVALMKAYFNLNFGAQKLMQMAMRSKCGE